MSPHEPPPSEDILRGEDIDTSGNLEANSDSNEANSDSNAAGTDINGADTETSQSLVPESTQEGTNESPNASEPEQSNQTKAPESEQTGQTSVPESEQTNQTTVPEPGTAVAESDMPILGGSDKQSTDDFTALVEIQTSMGQIEHKLKDIAETSAKTVGEVREMHKLYHNEFANRLKSMQEELEQYREIDRGRIYDGILGEIAKLYSDNESVIDDIAEAKVAKKINYMLMDIVQILEANGVHRQKSSIGDQRNVRFCQVVERIPTDNPSLHDTVAKSRSTGFYKENRALIKELVDIYLYFEKTDEQSGEN